MHLNSPAPLLPADLAQIRRWQDECDLGPPVAARIETWVRYQEQADGSWYDDPRACPVAPIFRLGIYLINDALRLLGEPEAVQVFESRLFTGRPTADNGQLAIRFRGGALASIFASFCVGDGVAYANACVLHFERGTVYANFGPPSGEAGQVRLHLVTPGGEGPPRVRSASVPAEKRSGAYQWDVFARAVRGEKLADEVTPEQVAAGIRVVRAMARAAASGRTEPV